MKYDASYIIYKERQKNNNIVLLKGNIKYTCKSIYKMYIHIQDVGCYGPNIYNYINNYYLNFKERYILLKYVKVLCACGKISFIDIW